MRSFRYILVMREKNNLFSSLQFDGYDGRLHKIPFSGAISKDKGPVSLSCGEVHGLPRLDPPDPPAGMPLPQLLHPPGHSHRWVLLWFAHRHVTKWQHGAIGCPVQARGRGCLWAAQQNQLGDVCTSLHCGCVHCPRTITSELPLPPALWDTAGLW